ncbi:hypothetical protein [uncultured Pseudoalteromonas sp.]|uniref:McrB family protein n=1 Tax=uncultured Pseudoalteromonas sp. TaxID=114053 RepID=UPI002596900D|nr:hypothetical protein [uncultured Pseudoalteromonas sp.]
MNFQEYCDLINDDQKVKAEKTLLLTYTNSKGEAFSISPQSIKLFLSFLLSNYEVVHSAWANVSTKKNHIYQYEEKSYREIYKSASDEDLKIISSTGRSQTKALTKLIAKLIGFLTETLYESPEVNTFFEEEKLRLALDKWSDFILKESLKKEKILAFDIKAQFKSWMIKKGLSKRTASSYSGSGITYCDKYISSIYTNVDSFYQLKPGQVLGALTELQKIDEWLQADKSGNSMYSAACRRLAEFLADTSYSYICLSKPFLLLAGISGTGKTRFVREQAKTSKQFSETYCLTSVRPDWHEPSDLLGYISRLTQDGSAEYITTDVLDFIAKAWRAIADSGLNLEVQDSDELGERLVVAGERDALEQVLPYWLCLDEMNLAPVEQYFADYLSVLETREWTWTGDSFSYSSDALLKPATIKAVANKEKLREALGFNGTQYDELWALICQYGLGIPFNLLVAGTVNMDETTHGFSRKVIDRALSFDFGEFFPNDYADFFTPTNRNKRLSYPIWSNASKTDLANTFDVDGTKTVAFLSAVNAVLKNTPFELAFRALNELLLAVASSQPQDDLTLKAVWDDFMMCKVLPRIEGDEDKLVGQSQHNILEALLKVLEEQLAGAWENGRPDLYREKLDPEGETITVDCRSKKKLSWMNDQLVRGFTSFWP